MGSGKKHSTELAVLEVKGSLDHDVLIHKLHYYGVSGSALGNVPKTATVHKTTTPPF